VAAARARISRLSRSDDDRVIAGVCSGLARSLGVDVTVVRLVFAILALASGSGIVLYLGAWALMPAPGEPPHARTRAGGALALILLVAGALLALRGLGLANTFVWPAALAATGAVVVWRTRTQERRTLPAAIGVGLILAGAVVFLNASPWSLHNGGLLVPGAVTILLVAVVGPWLWRLARERDAERLERIRTQERAELAARVHDSVLQTLTLIQREADDPRQVARLARQQERELRSWLYGVPGSRTEEGLVAALERAAAEVEERHGSRVEVVAAGDCTLDAALDALVLAAREAMTNAAKFSGVDEISVYAEVGADAVAVYVRDRGAGFDRSEVAADRRGLSESIEGRMARHGGRGVITSGPSRGTEVELTLPRPAS
jgi:signal transduction histidine kinase